MKRLLLLICLMSCTACAALPAEERSFAVALGVSGREGGWTLYARIPTYQTGGGYATVTGEGDTMEHALAALDAASPMELHLGQLRLLIFAADTARSADFAHALAALSDLHDLRAQAALAVTEADMAALMEAMQPATGTRLSKSMDVLLQTRIGQGVVLSATLAEVQLMGERQQPVLMNVTLEGDSFSFSGGWPLGDDGRVSAALTPEETQLLSLMRGELKSGTVMENGAVIE